MSSMLDKVKQEIEDTLVKYGVYEWGKATNEILRIAAMLALDTHYDNDLRRRISDYLEKNP